MKNTNIIHNETSILDVLFFLLHHFRCLSGICIINFNFFLILIFIKHSISPTQHLKKIIDPSNDSKSLIENYYIDPTNNTKSLNVNKNHLF